MTDLDEALDHLVAVLRESCSIYDGIGTFGSTHGTYHRRENADAVRYLVKHGRAKILKEDNQEYGILFTTIDNENP